MSGIKKDILWRIYFAFVCIALFGVAIIIQIGKIQFIDGDEYRAKADSSRLKYEVLLADRGSIFSADGDLLAASFPYYNLICDPCAPTDQDFSEHINELSTELSKLFGDRSKAEYKNLLTTARRQNKRYVSLYKKATVPQMQAVKNMPLFNQGRFSGGLMVEQIERRKYPYGSLALRTIGYVKEDKKIGLEGAFQDKLSGTPGKQLKQKISGGTWLPVSDNAAVEPIDGMDLITTLDINMQDITEAALRKSVVANNATWGTAIVMEVKTGKIKAVANLTKTSEGMYEERLNYAISEKVEPGSTWKLFTLMALFEDGLSSPTDTIDLHNGIYQYPGGTMNDSEGKHGRRNVNVKTAFALSSNVGLSLLAYKNYGKNKEQYVQHIIDSKINQKTGIEISGEPKPYFKTDPKADNWYTTTLPWMGVGYEIEITPLQLCTFYNAVANGGKMMKPYLVQEFQHFGETIEKFEPVVLNEKMCSKTTIEDLHECLQYVVDSGTAKRLRNEYYDFAGKTGTAQLIENGAYVHKYLASFAGFFPSQDPMYTIIVMINNPSNGVYYGGAVAGPVFREIADKIFSHHIDNQHPVNKNDSLFIGMKTIAQGNKSDVLKILDWLKINPSSDSKSDWIAYNSSSGNTTQSLVITENTMPSVIGMGLRDALYLLENAGLHVQFSGKGKVTSQSITKGQSIQEGMYVSIQLN